MTADNAKAIQNQTVKDPTFSPVQGKTQPSTIIDCREFARPLIAPEEHPLHAWGRSACRGIHNIADSCRQSMRIRKTLANFLHRDSELCAARARTHALTRARTKLK